MNVFLFVMSCVSFYLGAGSVVAGVYVVVMLAYEQVTYGY